MAIGCWAVLSQAEPEIKRAHILLAADAVAYDEDIAAHVGVGDSTFYRTKRRFVLGNVEAALSEEPRSGGERQALVGQGRCTAGGDGLRPAAARACRLDAGVTEAKDC